MGSCLKINISALLCGKQNDSDVGVKAAKETSQVTSVAQKVHVHSSQGREGWVSGKEKVINEGCIPSGSLCNLLNEMEMQFCTH